MATLKLATRRRVGTRDPDHIWRTSVEATIRAGTTTVRSLSRWH